MSDPNKHSGGQLNETGTTLPADFIEVNSRLSKKGWQQVDTGKTTEKNRGGEPLEVQRLILEKPCSGSLTSIKKIQVVMVLKGGKVRCQMFTEPFMGQFLKESTKDVGHMNLLMQEIDDYYELMNPSPQVMDIQRATRENMKTTQRLIRGANGKWGPEDGATLSA